MKKKQSTKKSDWLLKAITEMNHQFLNDDLNYYFCPMTNKIVFSSLFLCDRKTKVLNRICGKQLKWIYFADGTGYILGFNSSLIFST
jgi:hypothetical protein